jgi:RNA-directed DNA polymerase
VKGPTLDLSQQVVEAGSGTRADAEALLAEVAAVLAPMGLALSAAKTAVSHIDEGFEFLGFHIQRRRKRGTAKRVVYTYLVVSQSATSG